MGYFLPFYPWQPKKWKSQKNEKNVWRYHHFTQLYQKLWLGAILFLRYGAWPMLLLFFILGYFLPFYPSNSPKNENFKKMKKMPGDIIILHTCTKSYDYRLYCSWDMVHGTCNFYFWSWAIFCPFTTPSSPPSPAITVQKIKYQRMDGRTDGLI